MWNAPAIGTFVIDHKKKQLHLIDKNAGCDAELLERTVVAFVVCGYEVVDDTGGAAGGGGGFPGAGAFGGRYVKGDLPN